ncbi:MAG: hypothetical protein ABIU86_06430 [Gemmatimonadaceae bacterium]
MVAEPHNPEGVEPAIANPRPRMGNYLFNLARFGRTSFLGFVADVRLVFMRFYLWDWAGSRREHVSREFGPIACVYRVLRSFALVGTDTWLPALSAVATLMNPLAIDERIGFGALGSGV